MIIFIHQSPINLTYPHEKQIRAKLKEGLSVLKGICFVLCFPKLRNIYFSKEKFFIDREVLSVKELDMILT